MMFAGDVGGFNGAVLAIAITILKVYSSNMYHTSLSQLLPVKRLDSHNSDQT